MKKQISASPFLKKIKEIRKRRFETQKHINTFLDEKCELERQEAMLLGKLYKVQTDLKQKEHLIEMYRVMDDHRKFDLHELEVACGITKKEYFDWNFDFERTKDGFPLETFRIKKKYSL